MQHLNPRLTRGEYWILESLVENALPLCWLGSDQLGRVVNKPAHGLDRSELVDALESLSEQKLIGARNLTELKDEGNPHSRLLVRKQIEAALDEVQCVDASETYLGLTAEGGRVWEAFALPDWNAYVDAFERGCTPGKNSLGVVTSVDYWRVHKILQHVHLLGHFFNAERVRWRVVRPWQATYWKTLPEGHRAVYLYQEIKRFHGSWAGFHQMPHGFVDLWENRAWYRWK